MIDVILIYLLSLVISVIMRYYLLENSMIEIKSIFLLIPIIMIQNYSNKKVNNGYTILKSMI